MPIDSPDLDWGRHADQKHRYIGMIERLRAFHNLPWNEEWRALQAACIAGGVRTTHNPVPALLARCNARKPHALDLDWAQHVDRDLRRPSDQSPHGRADLARTFAVNVARLDALHAVPEVAATGLLPAPIGPIR